MFSDAFEVDLRAKQTREITRSLVVDTQHGFTASLNLNRKFEGFYKSFTDTI